MKRLLFTGLLLLAFALPQMVSAADALYENDGAINSPPDLPPQIDATNFVNKGLFNIGFNNFNTSGNTVFSALVFNTSILPFDFSDVLNYTNRGSMLCDTGFRFDTAPSGSGPPRHMAASFGNANVGLISAGSFTNGFTSFFVFFTGIGSTFGSGTPQIQISATNIVNNGLLDVGFDGLINITGKTLNLARGSIHVEGFDDFANTTNNVFNGFIFGTGFNSDLGIFGNYTGGGLQTNQIQGVFNNFNNFNPPSSLITNNLKLPGIQQLNLTNPRTFAYKLSPDPSNNLTQVVFVNTNLSNVTVDVGFNLFGNDNLPEPVVHWTAVVTNADFATPVTNDLYLTDSFGTLTNNPQVFTNSSSLDGLPVLGLFNYSFTRTFTGFTNLASANAIFSSALFSSAGAGITNQYTAYGVTVSPQTFIVDPTASISNPTNLPGRLLINADTTLDLTRSKITGPNYLRLTATNHFIGSSNAQLVYPNADISLGTTNGQLYITNLVAPFVPRLQGPIDVYSARWTNVVAGVTNRFHILIVDSQLSAPSPVSLQNVSLRSTNIVISDRMNIVSNLFIDATSLTITSNLFGSRNQFGELNLASTKIIWSSSLSTNLQFVTNSGLITAPNTVFFQTRHTPNFPSSGDGPYQTFVNHGSIFTSGNLIWANYVENSGAGLVTNNDLTVSNNLALIVSSSGPIGIQASNAIMANGALAALGGDLSINSGSLSISNHFLQTSGSLTFSVTNLFTDTGTNSSNFWQVADGINLTQKPTQGDLLGTTILSSGPAGLEVGNSWAALNRGANAAGFSNNAAIGHLILDGGDNNSTFLFGGPGATNAIYVDLIELADGATNRATRLVNGQLQQVYTAIDVDPNMTVYFADAMAGGLDISEKLNGTVTDSGGRVLWVPTYAGFFSSTNITYQPSGLTYTFNRGLALSSTIDSDGDGTPNANDSTPFFVSESIKLSMSLTNSPTKSAILSWQTLSGATNNVFTGTNIAGTNWSLITNFVSNVTGTVKLTNSVQAGGPHYYKVRVDPPHP